MYCTTQQVASAFGVHEITVKRWADSGLLPFIRLPSGHRRFPINGLRQFAEKNKPEALQRIGT
jgi:excisionase family DNA binding protein